MWIDLKNAIVPDIIVTPKCGGWIPARLLKDYSGCPEMGSISILNQWCDEPLIAMIESVEDKRVLIVDDIVDSGKTMKVTAIQIAQLKPLSITVAAIYYKTHSIIRPNVFGRVIPDATWVVFPWEVKTQRRCQLEDIACNR